MAVFDDGFKRQMAALKKRFLESLPERFLKMETACQSLAGGTGTVSEIENILLEVHNLSGTSGSFGLEDLGRKAFRIESFLRKIYNSGRLPDQEEARHLQTMIDQLPALARPHESSLPKLQPEKIEASALVMVLAQENQKSGIREQLTFCGFEVRLVDDVESLLQSKNLIHPLAILADVDLIPPQIQLAEANGPIVILFSSRDDFHTRLRGCDAGAGFFLKTPLDYQQILEILENQAGSLIGKPYRILIIDDDPASAEIHSFVLEKAGMITSIETRPSQTLDQMDRFQPDLILLDLYMPECSGSRVAAVLRQNPRFAAVPIIFISTELEFEAQVLAMRHGGEDFLTKPVEPQRLIDLVRRRVSRARQLKGLTTEKQTLLAELTSQRRALNHHALIHYTDTQGRITYANESYVQAGGYSLMELLGRNLRQESRRSVYPESLWETLLSGGTWRGKISEIRKDGRVWALDYTVSAICDERSRPLYYFWVANDISTFHESFKLLKDEMEDSLDEATSRLDCWSYLGEEVNRVLTDSRDLANHEGAQNDGALNAQNLAQASTYLAQLLEKTQQITGVNLVTEPEYRSFDIRENLSKIGYHLSGLAARTRVQFSIIVDPDVPEQIIGDAIRLRQLLSFYCQRSMATSVNGFVTLSLSLASQESSALSLLFDLVDSGSPISLDYDGDFSQELDPKLSIAKRLMNALGCKIQKTDGRARLRFLMETTYRESVTEKPLAGCRVLICADQSNHRDMLVNQLLFQGCEISYTGLGALAGIDTESLAQETALLVFYQDSLTGMKNFFEEAALHTSLILGFTQAQNARIGALLRQVPDFKPLNLFDFQGGLRLLEDARRNQMVPTTQFHQSGATSKTALLVEDNPISRKIAGRVLSNLGYTFDIAENGLEALAAFDQKHYDLILMDCQMPEMNGYQATAAIRNREDQNRRVPIIALTADDSMSNRSLCLQAGMNDCLAKPFSAEAFRKVIADIPRHENSARVFQGKVFAQPVRLSLLKQLSTTEGAHQFPERFHQTTECNVALLSSAIVNQDANLAIHICRNLQATSGQVGAAGFSALVGHIQQLCGQDRMVEAWGLLESLSAEMNRVCHFLDLHLNGKKSS